MQEETAEFDRSPEGLEEAAEPEAELLALRVQLVLSQLEHPSRWGRRNR